MRLCGTCGALMWGENCTNRQCDEHYNTQNRTMAKMLGLESMEEYRAYKVLSLVSKKISLIKDLLAKE